MFKQILNLSLLSLAVSLPLSALLYAQESAQKDTNVQTRANIVQENDDTAPHIQVAILLDTSSSMSGLINQTRTEIWSVINALSEAQKENIRPTLEIALYEYGQSSLPFWSRQIRQVNAFTADLDQLSESLFSLTTNGGEEYSGAVIGQAASDLLWSEHQEDLKVIIIAGNESFAQGPVPYASAIEQAQSKNILINTVHCGNRDVGMRDHWSTGARLGKGEYFSIDQNQEVVYIETPFDDEISELNIELNKTYLPYGTYGSSGQQRQQAEDRNSDTNRRAYISRSLSKSSSYYNNSSWDIVDASDEERFSVEDIQEDDLPEILKNKSTKEKQTVINEYKEKRDSIKKRLAELKKLRAAYLREHTTSDTNTLGDAIIKALRKQAAQRNFIL